MRLLRQALAVVVCAATGLLVAGAPAGGASPKTPRVAATTLVDGLVVPRFRDATAQAGVTTTVPDATCGSWMTGAAWGDVNGDGWLDLYVTRLTQPTLLFINDGRGHFTEHALDDGVQTSGASAAQFVDYDNDGRKDLFVVRSGQPDILYHNDGGAHFTDVTAAAGINTGNLFGSSASWADYDDDGKVDLYVTNYAQCGYPSTSDFNYQPDELYHNNGDGTFTDVTSLLGVSPTTGLGSTLGAGFEAAWFDANGDNRQDLYLGNDYFGPRPDHNRLWISDGVVSGGQWQFQDDSAGSGTAYSMNTMGIGIGDYNNDLKLDIALSNIRYNRLLRNNGDGTFTDVAPTAGVDRRTGQISDQVPVTWGTAFYDFNLDGWEDLYFAAANFYTAIDAANRPQPNELYVNKHDGTFVDMSQASGAGDPGASKGVAFADYDRDGRMDMFLVNQNGTPRLYRNVTPMGDRHWLEVNPVGTRSNRDGCGARMILKTATGSQLREVFCGSNQHAVLFGLGDQQAVLSLTITWPSGLKQVLRNVKIDHVLRAVEPAA
jgi:hypothetical protein